METIDKVETLKTLEEIKAEILADNPSRQYTINDEVFEQTDEEFNQAVAKRAQMIFTKQNYDAELAAAKAEADAKRQALLERLGITEEEAKLLLG